MIIIIVFILFLLTIWIWYYPELLLAPLNILYNLDPSPRTNFYTREETEHIFPVSIELESIWKDIRREGYNLYESLPNKDINYLDNYHMNIGNETKRQWTTIPLRLFGRDSVHYMNECPIMSKLLIDHPEIKSCLFSIMEPGKIIEPHIGPYDGLLRYQLALDIPLKEISSQECYLHVGGEQHEWIEGKGIMFDESNLHGAINTTSAKRMVLLIDLERPYSLLLYRILNKIIIWGMGSLPATKHATLI